MTTSPSHDAYLLDGAERRPSDMHARTGYSIWRLVDVWNARGQSGDALITEYALDPREWHTAEDYYFAHQSEIDARRRLNDEAGMSVPGAIRLEDLLEEQADSDGTA